MNITRKKPVSNKILSYTLFIAHKKDIDFNKYMKNLPALLITSLEFYRDFQIRIHVWHELVGNPFYKLLSKFEDCVDRIALDIVHEEYDFFEPSMWRMGYVFDKNVSAVFCRDMDAVPNLSELIASRAFLNSKFTIHAIRSHPAHNYPDGRILAGLCGFKPDVLPINDSFETYFNNRTGNYWGCDQDTLVKYFIDDRSAEFVAENLLDTPIHSFAPVTRCPGYMPSVLPDEAYSLVDTSNVDADIKRISSQMTLWAGCNTSDVRGPSMNEMLELRNTHAEQIRQIIDGDSSWKSFYKRHIR